jgi:hypothetical protein
MLVPTAPGESFKPVPRRKAEVGKARRGVDGQEPPSRHTMEITRKCLARGLGIDAIPNVLRGPVCELQRVSPILSKNDNSVKR